MNVDFLYAYLMNASLFMLGTWAIVLVLACVVEFRNEWS